MLGGPIEQNELQTLPNGAFYTIQTNTWMDKHMWEFYLEKVLKPHIEGPNIIVFDNLACHTSK